GWPITWRYALAGIVSVTGNGKHAPAQAPNLNRRFGGLDVDLRLQRAVDRALLGDLEEARTLLAIKVALEGDDTIDVVDHPFLCFAFGAIGGVNSAMPEPDRGPLQRQALAVGIKPDRHRGGGAPP